MKLKRGTFAATFFLACLAAMELEGVGWMKSSYCNSQFAPTNFVVSISYRSLSSYFTS
ncbi:hypothetical protein SAMN05443248_1315 [Bradyrhizobium erythrophlei]|uniref:DUF6471 domain-containing protein n=1 Tax=Bradyrhizobium erythrophlei TaxID=1437360 RepID=A0A1M5J9C8_9BRAD|nr:hypothetical protein SAMN05443248_1315 [Bradyrhizobium erythrophlei]